MNGPFIAVDWGTSNRRAYRVEAGRATRTERDARGMRHTSAAEFPREAEALRASLGDLPMLCVGMVGSRRGWWEVPYVQTPASLASLAAATLWVEPGRTAIVPGASHQTPQRSDVMRGEEVQFLGAVAAGLVPEAALLCQPGTHSKWARVVHGAAYVSGLLIGSDVHSHLAAETRVCIIGDAPLAPLYAAAVELIGGQAAVVDSNAAFLAGATQLWKLL